MADDNERERKQQEETRKRLEKIESDRRERKNSETANDSHPGRGGNIRETTDWDRPSPKPTKK